MKSFQEYLMESQAKTYDFKVKIAVRITDEMLDQIEQALKAVDLAKVGKPKFLPMQTYREFPAMGPIEATLLDVSVNFPVNEEQIKNLIVERAFINSGSIFVYTKGQFEIGDSITPDANFDGTGESILTKDLEKVDGGQEQVGDKRVSNFMKELSTRKYELEGEKTAKAKTTNELPMGTTSPYNKGSKK